MSLDFIVQLYRINDIIGRDEGKELVLSPCFQRRAGNWKHFFIRDNTAWLISN